MKGTARPRLEWLLVAPWRLALLVALTLAVPVLLLNESAVRLSEERFAEERRTETVAAAERAAGLVDVWILSLRQRMAGAVEVPDLKSATRSKDVASLTNLLLLEIGRVLPSGARERDVVRLTVADEDGRVIYGVAPPAIPGEDLSARDFFQRVAGRTTAIGAVTAQDVLVTDLGTGPSAAASGGGSQSGGGPGLAAPSPDRMLLVAPIKFGLDPFVGVLIAEVDRRSVAPFLASARGDARDIYLIDRTGRLISRAGDPGDARDLGGFDPAAAALTGALGVSQGADPIDGAAGLVATARVPETGWITLAVRTPTEADIAADATLQQQRFVGGSLALILVVASVLIGTATSRSIRRRDALAESLEQQSALSGILRTITARPGELEPVLDAIAENAVRFCRAEGALIHLVEPDALRIAALWNWSSDPIRAGETQVHPERWRGHRLPLDRGTIVGAAVIDRRTTQAPDLKATAAYPETRRFAADLGFRAMLTSPIRRGDKVVGALSLRRVAPGAFSERDIALADAFAVHAGTAIENARLFNETKEALEQQTAVAEVLASISRSVFDLKSVLDTILERAVALSGADSAQIGRVEGEWIVWLAGRGPLFNWPVDTPFRVGAARLDGQTLAALSVRSGTRQYVEDAQTRPELPQGGGPRTRLAVPLLREGKAFGTLMVFHTQVRPFSEREIALVETFADQAAIAMENVRLFNETKEALERQTAVSGILQVISSSPTDVQPVLDAIAESAARFCAAEDAVLGLVEGDAWSIRAHFGAVETVPHAVRVSSNFVAGRAIVESRVVHVLDLQAERSTYPEGAAASPTTRTILSAPMLRAGKAVGSIILRRTDVRAFSEREIDLVRTFADQAAIAIENVRLFNETKEALEQQTAIGEVLAAISSSVFDLESVLRTISGRARALCSADACSVWRVLDDDRIELLVVGRDERIQLPRAGDGSPGLVRQVVDRDSPILAARCTRSLRTEHVADAREHPELPQTDMLARLAVPILKDGRAIGALLLARLEPRAFSAREEQIVQTFAAQAGIAMDNVRLFNEIQEKSAQLAEASRHKSEFLANMSHELRTPLNAIIGFSEVLREGMFGELNERQREYMEDIRSSGQHLLSLINDVLDLSKVEAGRMELELGEVSLASVVEDSILLVRERAGRHGITVATDIPADLPALAADGRKLKQAVLNLVTNAVKFTPDGGWVGVTARREADDIVISVRDTGVGIAPDDQARIFEEFRQAKRRDGSLEGTGLGLALTKRIVELHGGRIDVESELGKGSTFTVRMPLRSASVTVQS